MEKTITIIPATVENPKHLKVAAYCRVSTEHEEQTASLKHQDAHFTKLICESPDWDFAGIYADTESGIGVYNRDEFNRMLGDCSDGKIDLILTKSMCRWSRNTLDTLVTLQQLTDKGIEVRFEMENISTASEKVHEALVAHAAVAQHENLERSENIKWGIRKKSKYGKARLNHTNFLGCTKDESGNLVIVPEEAEIVRLIYSLCLDGYGSRKIAKHLEQNGVKTVTGKDKWSTSTIDRILSNEKYIGCLVAQKSYTDNFLNGKQIKNCGEVEQHKFENNHEAIIGTETFERVQERKSGVPEQQEAIVPVIM